MPSSQNIYREKKKKKETKGNDRKKGIPTRSSSAADVDTITKKTSLGTRPCICTLCAPSFGGKLLHLSGGFESFDCLVLAFSYIRVSYTACPQYFHVLYCSIVVVTRCFDQSCITLGLLCTTLDENVTIG